jgi:hypothetical protein
LVAAFGAASFAAAALATESTIMPGTGIGRVKLGMTLAQVQHVLGKYRFVNERSQVGRNGYLEVGWGFGEWTVGFLRQGSTYRTAAVEATVRGQRTPTGVGVGTNIRKVIHDFPQAICSASNGLRLLVTSKTGAQTIFIFRSAGEQVNGVPVGKLQFVVSEVDVRTPFRPQPEFSPQNRCRQGWQERGGP